MWHTLTHHPAHQPDAQGGTGAAKDEKPNDKSSSSTDKPTDKAKEDPKSAKPDETAKKASDSGSS